jgi:hypothetical protein
VERSGYGGVMVALLDCGYVLSVSGHSDYLGVEATYLVVDCLSLSVKEVGPLWGLKEKLEGKDDVQI